CLTIRITVCAKRGSPIDGAAIKSCPVRETVSPGSAAGESSTAARIAAAGSEKKVERRAEGIPFLLRKQSSLHRRSRPRKAMLKSLCRNKEAGPMPNQSWIITTIVGTGEKGFAGDGGPAERALLNGPFDLGFDAVGNLYFSDTFNHRIRRVDRQTGI